MKKYLMNFVLILGLTGFALWLALKDNYQVVLDAISKMKPLSLIIILCWGILYTVVWGLVYLVMGKKYNRNYTFTNGIVCAFVGTFMSGITPSSTGGQFAQAYILKKQGIKVSDGASLLWADFIIYQTTMMIYVTILFLLKFAYYSKQSSWFNMILLGYVVNAIVVVALYTMALFPKFMLKLTAWAGGVMKKIKFIKNPEQKVEAWNLQVQSFTKEIKVLAQDKKNIVVCSLINIVRLTLLYSLPFVVARALGINLEPEKMLDVIALSSFVLMANSFIPVPGASGGTEVVFSLMFQSMMGTLTGAVMVLWRFSTYHVIILIGGIIFTVAQSYYDKRDSKSKSSVGYGPTL